MKHYIMYSSDDAVGIQNLTPQELWQREKMFDLSI